MIKTKEIITALVALIMSLSCFASAHQKWSGRLNIEQLVYEDISVNDARAIAVEKIKLLAAEKAGEFILNTETIVEGEYTQSIEIIGGGLVSLDDIKDEYFYINGKHTLSVSATAEVDISTLVARLEYIQENDDLRDLIAKQNDELIKLLNGEITSTTVNELVPARNRAVSRLFGKDALNTLESKIESDRAIAEISFLESTFVEVIKESEITASIERMMSEQNYDFEELPPGKIKILRIKVSVISDVDLNKLGIGRSEFSNKIAWIDLIINGVAFRKIFLSNTPGEDIYRNNLHHANSGGKNIYHAYFDVKLTPYVLDGPLSSEAIGDIKISAELGYGDRVGVYFFPNENIGINGKTLIEGEWDKAKRFYIAPLEFRPEDYTWVRTWSSSVR